MTNNKHEHQVINYENLIVCDQVHFTKSEKQLQQFFAITNSRLLKFHSYFTIFNHACDIRLAPATLGCTPSLVQ
jgi:hypothetical protein